MNISYLPMCYVVVLRKLKLLIIARDARQPMSALSDVIPKCHNCCSARNPVHRVTDINMSSAAEVTQGFLGILFFRLQSFYRIGRLACKDRLH
ncbi:hypothetical protein AVEN_35671-1 [Araneus ventricosus]|uniref:Uncharacterized protein n=1 Tax=Araneus ventricosus TaxID=182803 RepID=A0A4Y2GDI2_ARAVE|nr:hypothetical protein AVEN_35671-1 [Araneus ventricosus]